MGSALLNVCFLRRSQFFSLQNHLVKVFDFDVQDFPDPDLLELALEAVDFHDVVLLNEALDERLP